MTYTPKPKNKKPGVAALVLLITAIVLFFLGAQYYTKGRTTVQVLGVACLAVAVFFIIKRLTSYTYTVYPKDKNTKKSVSELTPSELTLVISKRTGSTAPINRAELELSTLTAAVTLPSSHTEARRVIKELGKMNLYYYTVTFNAPDTTLLVFKQDSGESVGIILELDSDLKAFFSEVARINTKG